MGVSKQTVAWTDGACSGNPGPGGWGVFLVEGGKPRELCGGESSTTNNRMELLAAIRALEAVPEGASIEIRTDSEYLRKGITEWMRAWKRNGWKTAARKPVKNRDLWECLDALASRRSVRWSWVRGHAGDPGNEAADALANRGMRPFRR